MEYILHVMYFNGGDDADSKVEKEKFKLYCNYGY